MAVMRILDDIRTSQYRRDYLELSGISGYQRYLAIQWLTSVRNYVNDMKTRSCRYVCRSPIALDYYNLYESALVEFNDEMKQWIKTAFQYIYELSLTWVPLGRVTANSKAALILFLIRYILRKYCDCDAPDNNCRHRFMEVWPSNLARLTGCRQTGYFLHGAMNYANLLFGSSRGMHIFNDDEHCSGEIAFSKYRNSVATDPKLLNPSEEDYGFGELYAGIEDLTQIEVDELEDIPEEEPVILQTFAEFAVYVELITPCHNELYEIMMRKIIFYRNSEFHLDGVLHSEAFHKTDVDEAMAMGEAERREQVTTAYNVWSTDVADAQDENCMEFEIEDLAEQNAIVEERLEEIQNKQKLMICMDEIRSSAYCSEFWLRSGVSHYRRAHVVEWISKMQRLLRWSDIAFYAAVDLLDAYLFVNVIVPSDYEMIAFACLILAHHIRDNTNLEEIYRMFPEIGSFYTINQVINYVDEMKTKSCRYLCRCPTVMDYYELYEPFLIEFEYDLKDWVNK
ncbi:unnamed protein product [Rodentolepis nana]|uniref:Cyclin N-terminal domain-containing protein n=1 Tax=Rodentolepis nana TaxID=102285 RepID=A0A0R3TKA3_RODNA|nr:unnamed protein product [Rodentolepis nana]